MSITASLRELKAEIEQYARGYGLDFCEVIFEVIDADRLNEVASYGGFPTRYPHWRFGMAYEELQKSYAYGLAKIYELVINNAPCYAYLMSSNSLVDQKLVMAHVYAHCDFFKNNQWFSHTNRKMVDQMANHGTRVRRHIARLGQDRVESFLDTCLSLENLIDVNAPFIRRRRDEALPEQEEEEPDDVPRLKSKGYLDRYINPPEALQAARRKRMEDAQEASSRFPESPERDVLQFLIDYAPLERWQMDCLAIVREEAHYFAPQARTKILNEGWAAYWHSRIMTEKCLTDAEVVDYADHNAGTLAMQPGHLNPYKLGVELLRDIEDRWNRGAFGSQYEACDDLETKRRWDKKLGLGRKKIFEVRRVCNDLTLLDTYLTAEFCERLRLFTYRKRTADGAVVLESRGFEEVKGRLLAGLTNCGHPLLAVVEGNFRNRAEMLLEHAHEGVDLDLAAARETMERLFSLWTRPVHVRT
ncbi:MAG: SpoVR family protein, partial [Planctomycetes bacterium]|nr:SpoVR family protein [Planctomycetota bacterium]